MLFLVINEFCNEYNVLAIILFIKKLLNIIFMLVPICLIVMLSIDLAKNVIAKNEDDMKKNINIFIKRILYCVAIFFVMPIVTFSISLLGNISTFSSTSFVECYNGATDEAVSILKEVEDEKEKQTEAEYEKEIAEYVESVKEETSNSNNNNSTNNKNIVSYDGTIYVGDSRTVQMCNYLNIYNGSSFKSGSDELCIAKSGEGLSWLKNTAEKKILKILKANPKKNYNIIINLGVNNMYHNSNPYSSYVKEYNSFNKKIGDSRLIVVSVTQTNYKSNGTTSISNTTVKNFNSKLKSNISSSINYCDAYGYLEKSGYSWSSKNDGLHYDKETYKKIYKKLNSCISSSKTVVDSSSSGAEKILDEALKFVKKIKADGDWVYGSTNNGYTGMLNAHKATCGKFVSYILYNAGYIDEKNCIVGHANTGVNPKNYKCLSKDIEIITKNTLGRNIKMSDLKEGDVVVRNGISTHDIAIFAYKKNGSYYYYSANGDNTIKGYRKSTAPQARAWFSEHGITSIIRAKR